ncbi:MAG: sulfite exporter TauE/SafE family protein [SAR324 cluster bacterium]|nr:sulfite exporter TauE/SafE family protein [SAR324 cluster bacterium]
METESAPSTPIRPHGLKGLFSPRLALIGLGAGLLNGLFSIGGGILLVPGLIILRNVTPRVAVSASLGAVLLMSIVALAAHVYVSGFSMSLEGAGLLILAGMAAAQLGGWLLNRLSQRWIFFIFSGLTLFSAAHLLALALAIVPPLSHGEPPLWSYPLIGAVSGVFSGMLGVGGGGLAVLAFSIGFDTPVLGGLPMALAVNVFNSLSGVLAQAGKGNVLWSDVLRIFPATLVGIAAGVALAVWLPPDGLRIIFALFFVYIGTSMFKMGWRQ